MSEEKAISHAEDAIEEAEQAVGEAAATVADVAEEVAGPLAEAGLQDVRTALRGIEASLAALPKALQDIIERSQAAAGHAAGAVEEVADVPVTLAEDAGDELEDVAAPLAPVDERPEPAQRRHRRRLGHGKRAR